MNIDRFDFGYLVGAVVTGVVTGMLGLDPPWWMGGPIVLPLCLILIARWSGETMREDEAIQRQSQVTEQLVALNLACEKLHKAIEQLEERLVPVLRSLGPCSEEKGERAPVLVGLAQQLSERVGSVEYASVYISGIQQRLEL